MSMFQANFVLADAGTFQYIPHFVKSAALRAQKAQQGKERKGIRVGEYHSCTRATDWA
jgi:hypothetical protein